MLDLPALDLPARRTLLRAVAALPLSIVAHRAFATPTELPVAHPGDVPGKVEVLDFFWYGCNHCHALEPLFNDWMAQQSEADVVVRRIPVGFNAGMRPSQQLYYTLEAMDRLDLHAAVFRAIHVERQRLSSKSAIVAWAKKQGLDEKRFADTFDSFGVTVKVDRANTLWKTYNVEGTPTIAVGGRFITSPGHAGGYRETVVEVDQLVKQLVAQRR